MPSSFFEFNVASSGLFVAKAGLAVTSHNIANETTVGYTRQVAQQRATTPIAVNNGTGMLGTGAEVYGVGQIRSFYLDKKYWSEKCVQGEYETKRSQLSLMETVFNEMSKSGLSTMFQNYFNSINELTFSADDRTYRTSVINHTLSLIESVQNSVEILKKQQRDANEDIAAIVQRVNSIGVQISNLNEQIYKYELDGSSANDLRDERAKLVDELSQYVNVDVKETERTTSGGVTDKVFSVLINGQELVNHLNVRQLVLEKRAPGAAANEDDVEGLYDILWSAEKKITKPVLDDNGDPVLEPLLDNNGDPVLDDNGDPIFVTKTVTTTIPAVGFNTDNMSGQLKGLLDIRDGNNSSGAKTTTSYKGIPYYIEKINSLIRTFAESVNDVHLQGYDSNGNQGGLFFSYTRADGTICKYADPDFDYADMNVQNLTLSQELLDDPDNLAASRGLDESDNEIILEMLGIKDDKGMFQEGSIMDYIVGISSELAIDTKQAVNFSDYYEEIIAYIDTQRLQISGVSMNEEMINLLRYQQLYQASSKLIKVIDEIYNTTINGLGL